MRRLILVASLAAVCGSAAFAATAGASSTSPRNYNECYAYLRGFQSDLGTPPNALGPRVNYNSLGAIANATWCGILTSRKAKNVGMPVRNTTLIGTSGAHATASAMAHSWDLSNGLVSHLNPGTAVPGDQTALQNLVNTQVDQRIRGAGYCANGSSYADAEITFATPQSRKLAEPAATKFWRTDPPHAAVLYDPKWTDIGVSVATPSAFPGQTTGYTFVVDLGMCK
jgi:hypothetical protein